MIKIVKMIKIVEGLNALTMQLAPGGRQQGEPHDKDTRQVLYLVEKQVNKVRMDNILT